MNMSCLLCFVLKGLVPFVSLAAGRMWLVLLEVTFALFYFLVGPAAGNGVGNSALHSSPPHTLTHTAQNMQHFVSSSSACN